VSQMSSDSHSCVLMGATSIRHLPKLHPLQIDCAYLWCLRLDLSGTSEGSVNFTHDCG
jgi:hypothetical protein